jgi:tRNA (cytidine/uridine-2'-O-)-methyltransferase
MTFPWPELPFHIVLVEPEIPPNTGNIARTCAATGSVLHLVHPLGFEINDKQLKRAGLDYWPYVDIHEHASLEECLEGIPPDCVWFLSKKVTRTVYEAKLKPGDYLVFGPETRGLPEALLDASANQSLTLPMQGTAVRSLNLATSVGITLFEALRQASE